MMPEKETAPDRNYYPPNERLRFERLISEMATCFINLPIDEIDRQIVNTLRIVSEFFDVDRSTLFELAHRPDTIRAVHTYTSAGIDPVAGMDVGKLYPWCWHKFQSGENVVLSSRGELPDEAVIDLENMKNIGLQSFIGVPIRIKGIFQFLFTMVRLRQSQRWHPDLISRIQLVGLLLGNALHRKRMEMELAKLATVSNQFHNELSHRDRIGTISALTAAIAHEIYQPLTSILTNAQAALNFLAQNPPDLEEIRQILTDIVVDDKRASAVIHNVRNMLKEKEWQNEHLNINRVVLNAIHIIRSEAISRSISITEDLCSHPAAVTGDPILIQQVVLNLVINGMDAMKGMDAMNGMKGKKARITILTRSDENGWIDVHVCDTGPGVDQTIQAAIFKNLYTSKPDGLGIGLILCRSIIEAHGGAMSTENLPEGGARFSFRLPVRDL